MNLWRILPVALAALLLSGCGKSLYEFGAEQLRKDPALRAEATRDCVRDTERMSLAERQLLASVMKVNVGRMPQLLCRRIVNAVASGRLTHADLNDKTSDKVLRVIEGR